MRRPSCLADKRGTLSRAAGLAGMRHMLSADEQLSQAVCRGKPGDFSGESIYAMSCLARGLLTRFFKSCCGKRLCIGCHYTHSIVHGKHRCPFCRKPYVDVARDQKNNIRRAKEKKDPHSILIGECLARPNALVSFQPHSILS